MLETGAKRRRETTRVSFPSVACGCFEAHIVARRPAIVGNRSGGAVKQKNVAPLPVETKSRGSAACWASIKALVHRRIPGDTQSTDGRELQRWCGDIDADIQTQHVQFETCVSSEENACQAVNRA